jgi:hypothetical protein
LAASHESIRGGERQNLLRDLVLLVIVADLFEAEHEEEALSVSKILRILVLRMFCLEGS